MPRQRIRDGWKQFRNIAALHINIEEVEAGLLTAFYAGASTVMDEVKSAASEELTDSQGADILEEMDAELDAFNADADAIVAAADAKGSKAN